MDIEANKQINMNDIENFEVGYSLSLPEDYKQFLLKYNGGEPNKYLFKDKKLGTLVLNVFYGINIEDSYDELNNVIKTYKGRIHSSFIPIGDDPGGNQFVLGIKGKFKDKVYFWDHNTELENDEFSENVLPGNMYLLANSFDEFIGKLEEDSEA